MVVNRDANDDKTFSRFLKTIIASIEDENKRVQKSGEIRHDLMETCLFLAWPSFLEKIVEVHCKRAQLFFVITFTRLHNSYF